MIAKDFERSDAAEGTYPHSQEGARHDGASAVECVSLGEPYLCAGDR